MYLNNKTMKGINVAYNDQLSSSLANDNVFNFTYPHGSQQNGAGIPSVQQRYAGRKLAIPVCNP